MRRTFWLSAVLVLAMLGSTSARAASLPNVQGTVSGIELCPQFICGVAVFAGAFHGQIGWNRWALGTIAVAVTHDPLPEVGDCANITGGAWELRAGLRRIGGYVQGRLCANADDTFDVETQLVMTYGGVGTIDFYGLLDHNYLIPRISGAITQ
jgi:hypothetical protein